MDLNSNINYINSKTDLPNVLNQNSPIEVQLVRAHKKRGIKKGYIKHLQKKLLALEETVRKRLNYLSPVINSRKEMLFPKQSHRYLHQPSSAKETAPKQCNLDCVNFVVYKTLNFQEYLGESSLPYVIQDSISKQNFNKTPCPVLMKSSNSTIFESVDARLTKDVLKCFFESYLCDFYQHIPIVDKDFLLQNLDQFTSIDALLSKGFTRNLLYSIIATCNLLDDAHKTIDGNNITKLRCDCYELLFDNMFAITSDPTIVNVQTMIHFILAINPRNRARLWINSGSLVQMAYHLNLNCECHVRMSDNAEIYRNIWWTCFVIDKLASLMYGRPGAIKPDSFTTSPPTFEPVENVLSNEMLHEDDHSDSIFRSAYFSQYIKLYLILGDIINTFYTTLCKSPPVLFIVQRFETLDSCLEEWFDRFNRLTYFLKRKRKTPILSLGAFVYFYLCKILIYKKLYSHTKDAALKSEYLQTMLKYSDNIRVLSIENQNSYLNYGFLFRLYPFFWCIIIYTMKHQTFGVSKEDCELAKRKIFEILRIMNSLRMQSYCFKPHFYKILDLLYLNNIILSQITVKSDDRQSVVLMGFILDYEKSIKHRSC